MGGLELCGGTHHAAIRPEGGAGGLHLIRIYRFQLLQRGRPGFSVAAGLSAIALATADVPPAVLSAVALTKAEAGGILPPGRTPGFQLGSQIIEPSRAEVWGNRPQPCRFITALLTAVRLPDKIFAAGRLAAGL